MNKKSNRFSPEVRERAVRMVHEHRGDYPSYAGPRIAVLTWPVRKLPCQVDVGK
jgi:hypothetical protein